MRYLGSKRRYAKDIIPILSQHLDNDTVFIDMCCGGCSIVSEMNHPLKWAIDNNEYIIALWKHLRGRFVYGNIHDAIPKDVTREEYDSIKKSCLNNDGIYSKALIGYVSTCCSYGGAYWGGYAAYNPKKNENHCLEAYNGVMKQVKEFKFFEDTRFIASSYDEVKLPEKAVIYVDPPYFGKKRYKSDFDHSKLWQWVRDNTSDKIHIFVSEYDAPSDFKCVWSKDRKETLSCKVNTVTERLFTFVK